MHFALQREYTHSSHIFQSFDTIVIIFMQIYYKIKIRTRLLRETYNKKIINFWENITFFSLLFNTKLLWQ